MTAPQRLVWAGRRTDAPGGIDGWRRKGELVAALAEADEIVVLDPLSFPWESLEDDALDVPCTVHLPAEFDAEGVDALLGSPLLSRLAPGDRLVEERADLRAELTRRYRYGDGVWGDPERTPAEHAEAHLAKRRFNVLCELLLRSQFDAGLGLDGVIALFGADSADTARVSQRLRRDLRYKVARIDDLWAGDFPGSGSSVAHVSIVLIPDGLTSDERVALLSAGHRHTVVGGALVVLARVVGAAPAPRTSVLLEEVQRATGQMVHLEDLQSVRWPGEAMATGVLLQMTSLRPDESW